MSGPSAGSVQEADVDVTVRLSHDALLSTLENHLRDSAKIHFREPNLNGWAMGGTYGSPDLLEIPKSYSRFVRRVFEVKATQSDLLADLREGKWNRYLPLCDRMIFAVQDGVDYEKHLRPLSVGIMVYKNERWRTVRAAPQNQQARDWPEAVWMALLFGKMGVRADSRQQRISRELQCLQSDDLSVLGNSANEKLAKKAQELSLTAHELERRKKALDERDAATEEYHQQRALKKIARIMGVFTYGETSEEDVLKEWANRTLNEAFAHLRDKLVEQLPAVGDYE